MGQTLKHLRRALFASLIAGAAACATTTPVSPGGRPSGETSVYGAVLAARYAGVTRDSEAASSYYERALEIAPDDPYLIERAFTSALATGDIETAVSYAERALAIEPADRLARVLLASQAVRDGRYGRARRYLEDRDLGAFNRVIGALVLAWARAGEGEVDAALASLDAPADAPILGHLMTLHRALILERAGRAEEAERAYVRALETGLMRAIVVDAYGRSLERAGRGEEARRLYLSQLSDNPEDAASRAGLDRIAEGRRPAPFVRTPAEGASIAVFGPAATLVGNAHSELAAVYLQLALYLDPENGAARYLLGELLARSGLEDEAQDVLEAAAPGDAYFLPARISAAWTYVRRDDIDAAVAALEALNAETDDRSARIALGDAYRAAERYQDASVVYDGLIADIDGPPAADDWRLYYARGVTYERLDRWEEAEADLFTALDLHPDQPGVLNYLGYSWVDRGERLEEAFDLIRRAVTLEPEAGYIVDSLGWAHYQLGEYDDAVRYLEQAVELDPQDPTINDHLGDAYWRVGRELEATFQWRRALTLDPDETLRDDVETKLASGLPEPDAPVLASDP